MAVNELSVTVIGLVGSDPVCYRGADGQVPFTRFRVASTPRVYDREHDAYVDGGTSWFTVKAFRQLALNVAECVRRGEPVVVHGRLRLVDWATPEGQQRTTGEITAESVGYDMNRGTARFTRTVHGPPSGDAAATAAGGPGGAADALVDVSGATVLEDDDPGDRVPEARIA